MSSWDAVLVLGGGVRDDGSLSPWVTERFDRALKVAEGAPIVCLSAGTVHRPHPLNSSGYPIFESVAGAAHLLSRGVAPERIQVEAASYDTVGNAYFAKLLHADPAGWRRLIIITSDFHMPRSRAIFDWVFGMGPGAYELRYEASPDTGMPADLLERRRAKEAASLLALEPLMRRIRDFSRLHQWIHSEHRAYNAEGWTQRSVSVDVMDLY